MSDNLEAGHNPLTPEQREAMIEMAHNIQRAISNNHVHVIETNLQDGTPVLLWCLMAKSGTGDMVTPNNKAEMIGKPVDVYPLCIFGRNVFDTSEIVKLPEGLFENEKHPLN